MVGSNPRRQFIGVNRKELAQCSWGTIVLHVCFQNPVCEHVEVIVPVRG